MKPGIDVIRGIPLFRALSRKKLDALNEASLLERLGPQEAIFDEGDTPAQLHILLSGFVAGVRTYESEELSADVISPVSPIGLAPVMLGIPTPMGARTMTSSRLVAVPMATLRPMIQADRDLTAVFLEEALTRSNEQAVDLVAMKLCSATQRLALFLLTLVTDPELAPARFVLPYEKQFLAAKLGCSQESLSRAFANLRGKGVETRNGIVVIKDADELRIFTGIHGRKP